MPRTPDNEYYRQRIINSMWNNMDPNMTIGDVQQSFASSGIEPVRPGEINPQQAYRDMVNRRQQIQINDAWKNVNNNMSVENFMDQFVGVDGQTQLDINGQKLRMRGIQNRNAGIPEQEIGGDIWDYINRNNINATIGDVQKSFEAAGVQPVNSGDINAQQAHQEMIGRRQQSQIEDAYKNIDKNTTIEEFMDRFVGIDGQTQQDIDAMKLSNRVKQNRAAGLSEQESIDDMWNYISSNNINASLEDVQKSFEAAGVEAVKPGEIDTQQAVSELRAHRDQSQIDDIYKNLDPNMSIEDFMDQFVGVDGQTQQDIDAMKLSNRVKQNKRAGLSEQESIDDMWNYINDNNLNASIEDVQKSFESAGVEGVVPGEVIPSQAVSELAGAREQERIDKIWNNLDPNMSVEDFMDQFVGIDGQTQQDIDRQKLINRVKQNRAEGLGEQEAIDDMWKYISDNNLNASVEDVQKSFEVARGVRPESDLRRVTEEAALTYDGIPESVTKQFDTFKPTVKTLKDGSRIETIDLGNDMFTNVKFDKDNNILSKGYTKGKDAYNVYYNTEGDIVSEAYKHNKVTNNVVEYNKKFEPTDITTTKEFDLETAKGLKSEANKLWEQLQYGGINDQIPYVHYKNYNQPINPNPNPQQPQPKPEPKTKPGPQPEPNTFNPEQPDPTLHFNQPDYKKYKMHDVVADEFTPTPLSSYDRRMKEYSDYIEEYERMQKMAQESALTSEAGARNYEKNKDALEKFFGKDKFSSEDAALKYEEAKLYGPHRDNPNDPLRRNSKAWWDEREELLRKRRAWSKNRQSFVNSEKAARELADTKFLHEVAANRDIYDLLRTQPPNYLGTPEVIKSITDADKWLKDEENIARYNSIPEEFRNQVEGDIKKKRFELNKARRNAKLDADYANFRSNYESLTASQKEQMRRLRRLESRYRKVNDPTRRADILDEINQTKDKIKDLKSQRKSTKKDMKRTNAKTRDRASNIKEEIGNIKNEINDNKIFGSIQEAFEKERAANPSLTMEQYLKDNYKNTRFENFKPKADYEVEQLKDKLQFHKDLLKEKAGIDIAKEEGDIVERGLAKLKKASKLDIAMSTVGAISKYKDSRKQGRGVMSSAARAGVDFAASQLMGPGLYMGLTAFRAAPKALVTGAMYLQNEVRQMNTASRFRVFGDASFQDSDQLATMRQSGMEMAKMANYNLEQTLMGNEARYLHK